MQTGATVHLVMMLILTPISVGTMALVVWWFIRTQHSSDDRVAQIWAQREAWGEPLCRRLINREIEAGMTPAMVKLAWGEPLTIQDERWQYPNNAYVLFEQDRAVEWSDPPPIAGQELNPWLVLAILLGLSLIIIVVVFIVLWGASQ